MATGAAFDDAVALARENPTLDIGCHLVLVGAEPFPATVAQLAKAVALKRIHVYDELRRQVARIADAGLNPTHLDTHKHTHLLPTVLDAVARLSEEFRIPWCAGPSITVAARRNPARQNVPSAGRWAWVRGRFARVLARHGCRSTDYYRRVSDHRSLRRRESRRTDPCAARRLDRIHVPPRPLHR